MQRVEEEDAGRPPGEKSSPDPIDLEYIKQCLYRSRSGDADLYTAMHRGKHVYVRQWGRWMYWSGHTWADDIDDADARSSCESLCEEYARLLDDSPPKGAKKEEAAEYDALDKRVRRRQEELRKPRGRSDCLECCLSVEPRSRRLVVDDRLLDQHPYLLATPTGVIDLRTGSVSPGRPEDYITRVIPTSFVGLEESGKFLDFLSASMDGDIEMRDYLIRLLGYSLLGVRSDHVWSLWHGPRGRNGKDTLIKVLTSVLGGELVVKTPTAMVLQSTIQRSGSQPEPDILALRGAKIAIVNEAEKGQRLAMSRIKELTGGGVLSARGIADKRITQWRQSHLLIMSTNEIPMISADDAAFWSRVQAVHWPLRFVPDPRAPDERLANPRIYEEIVEEAPGVLACLVRGAMQYLDRGLDPPLKVLSYTMGRRDSYDDVGHFLAECCVVHDGGDPKIRYPAGELLRIYNWWRSDRLGESKPVGGKRLVSSMESRGIQRGHSNGKYYIGISIRPEIIAEMGTSLKGVEQELWQIT